MQPARYGQPVARAKNRGMRAIVTRWYRVPVSEIAYVRAIVEAYDGVGTLSSPAEGRGELTLWVAPGNEATADELERRLATECGLQRLDRDDPA
jgi:hypothetical protein